MRRQVRGTIAIIGVLLATSAQAETKSFGKWTLTPGAEDCALTAASVEGQQATISLIATATFGWTIEIRSEAWAEDGKPAIGPDGHAQIGMTGVKDVPPGLLGFTSSEKAIYMHGTERQEDVIFVFNYLSAADAGDAIVGVTQDANTIFSQFDVDGFISGSRSLDDCKPTG